MTTVKLAVCGPNLNDRQYRLHVHAAGCGDLKHYGRGRKYGGDYGDPWWVVLVELSDKGVAYDVARLEYEDHISDHGYEYDSPDAVRYWQGCAQDIRVFPCATVATRACAMKEC